jgi:hypothetical protein
MKPETHSIFRISKQRGIWLRCFLGAVILPGLGLAVVVASPSLAQTVCLGTPAECKEAQKQLCIDEPAPANLFLAHSARLSGTFFDATGAPIDFDSIKPDHQTIAQIKSPETCAILFAVPLHPNGEFEFELVPEGSYRLILVWMKDGKFQRLPLADQPKEIRCSELKNCRISSTITFDGTDNPIDYCAPK